MSTVVTRLVLPMLRFGGSVALVALVMLMGIVQLNAPAPFAQAIMQGNLPNATRLVGFELLEQDAVHLAKYVGAVFLFGAAAVVVDLYLIFGGLTLAATLAAVTLCQHVNLFDGVPLSPAPIQDLREAGRNLGIIGGLLFIVSENFARRAALVAARADAQRTKEAASKKSAKQT